MKGKTGSAISPVNDIAPPPCRHGLSRAEAAARLAADGPNELGRGGGRSVFVIMGGVLREPMLLMLLTAAAIYLLLGDRNDALMLAAFACLTIGIAIVQEYRSERAIRALRELSTPHSLVIRDGRRITIASREVVRGDLLVIGEGGRITADGWVIEAHALEADESILTGESHAVSKPAAEGHGAASPPDPGGDGVPYVFSGTLVVRGSGLVRVAATGPATRIGQIGQSLASLESETPRLILQTRHLIRWFAVAGLGISLVAVLLFRALRGGWLDALLSGIALAMSLLPEELPVVLTLFMTIGALRMARVRVLARRGAAIETLGAATVLCTDKTGTLTWNRMQIAELRLPDGEILCPGEDGAALPQTFAALAGLGLLASREEPLDPMEQAFHDLARGRGGGSPEDRRREGWSMRRHYPLDPQLLAMAQAWKKQGQREWLVAAKGAPEAIADLCRLDAARRQAMAGSVNAMAARGLRVLAVAEARWQADALPESQRHFPFVWRGLVGLADPIRESVPGAVRELRQAGIRVIMITGDYPVTARAIADAAGIESGAVMTGEEVARASDAGLARRIGEVSVFARVMPEHKLRIVRALKAAGEIVAMTGDGVNDAPSLKAAHIGIAMGRRGTDVAREASAIVLLDDDFGAIVAAVRLGRRIYDNIRKAAGFIFAAHLPIGGLALAPLLTGWPLILGPVHIALLEMVIDPTCSLAFEAEPEEADVMRRPPRPPQSPLVSRGLLLWAAFQGLAALVMLLALAWWVNGAGQGPESVRTTVFAGLVAAIVVLVFVNRALRGGPGIRRKGHNLTLAAILGMAAAIFALLFFAPQAAALFRFAVLDRQGALAILVLTAALAGLLFAARERWRPMLAR